MPDSQSPVRIRLPSLLPRIVSVPLALVILQSGCGDGSSPPPLVSRLYVANALGNSITVYSPDETGDATPVATIHGPSTGINPPNGLALDHTRRIFLANLLGDSSITVYAADAAGDAAPVAVLAGPSTGLSQPHLLVFDVNRRLYASNIFQNSVTIFADGATGDATPVAILQGPHTGLDHPSGMTITGPSRGTVIP